MAKSYEQVTMTTRDKRFMHGYFWAGVHRARQPHPSGLAFCALTIALHTPNLVLAAAPPAPSPAVRAACTPDAKRLCGAVISDPVARHKCMVAHSAQLSTACKAALAASRQAPEVGTGSDDAAAKPGAAAPDAPKTTGTK